MIFKIFLLIVMILFTDTWIVSESLTNYIETDLNIDNISLIEMFKIYGKTSDDNIKAHLNIINDYYAFTQDKLFTAIEINDGDFSSSGKLMTEYYSYMSIIAFTENPDIVWALNFINVRLAGFQPGLYKITGKAKADLIRIADIEYKIEGQLLFMSCNLIDLMTDKDFKMQYDRSDKKFNLLSMTNLTRVFPYKTLEIDSTYPGIEINFTEIYNDD